MLVQRLLTWFPLRLAKSTSLQRRDHSQRLFGRTTNVEIVNDFVTEDAFGVDDKETTQGNPAALNQDAVVVGDFLGCVSCQGVLQSLNATLVTRCVEPRTMREN